MWSSHIRNRSQIKKSLVSTREKNFLMYPLSLYVLNAVLIAFVVLLVYLGSGTTKKAPLPPGPPQDPLIGHARMIPRQSQPELYHEWSKKYGTY
jgi:hypothetical protein